MAFDINYKLRYYVRNRIYLVLKYNGIIHSNPFELVGCSVEYLKDHLQEQFIGGMCWNNYGKWHVDHRKPCASFDLTDSEQQKICFHYKNLQPLWAKDNFNKNSYYRGVKY